MAQFHDSPYSGATQLKLQIFRGYIREWLPVFLTPRRSGRRQHGKVNLFDFFAGPGTDSKEHPGSPLLMVQEMRRFCEERQRGPNLQVRLFFNDLNRDHIERLRIEVDKSKCPRSCCSINYSALPFQEALGASLPLMRDSNSANLVVMDQFGVKEVTPDVVRDLAACGATDILFFISSSYIRRFIGTPELRDRFDIDPQQVKGQEYNATHRFVCDYFRERLEGQEYYLAPFSLKKGSNIYGLIFGSASLLGLQKFLEVCWKEDTVTGEANYNIDRDAVWSGQRSLFPELNTVSKRELFKEDLLTYIRENEPTNCQLYEFCLTKGFPPPQARHVLLELQKTGDIVVVDLESGLQKRAGAFYLSWKDYRSRQPRVRVTAKGGN